MKNLLNKIALVFILLFTIHTTLTAQSFREGTNVFSAGIGLGSSLLSSNVFSTSTPALSLQLEHGQWEVGGPGTISLGGYLGVKSYKSSAVYYVSNIQYNYTQKWSYAIIGLRSAYHFNGLKEEAFDPYGGVMLSYNILRYTYQDNDPFPNDYITGSYGSGLGLSVYVGGRYYFTDNLAAMAELGYGISFFTVGIAYQF